MIQIKVNGGVVAVVVPDLANMFVINLINSGLNAVNGYTIEVGPFQPPVEEKKEDSTIKEK